MTIIDLDGDIGRDLRHVSFKQLTKLVAHVIGELSARRREREHLAHLAIVTNSAQCAVCRNTVRGREP